MNGCPNCEEPILVQEFERRSTVFTPHGMKVTGTITKGHCTKCEFTIGGTKVTEPITRIAEEKKQFFKLVPVAFSDIEAGSIIVSPEFQDGDFTVPQAGPDDEGRVVANVYPKLAKALLDAKLMSKESEEA